VKYTCLILFLFLVRNGIIAQEVDLPLLRELKEEGFHYDTIKRVHDFPEFIKALDNNTAIIVDTGSYFLGITREMRQQPVKNPSYLPWDSLSPYYNNQTVHDVNNLIIIGKGISPPAFLQPKNDEEVLKFKNVNNLYIGNLFFKHSGYAVCSGDVLHLEKCRNVFLEKVELNGSGFQGLNLDSVTNLEAHNSLITGCTGYLSSFMYSRDITFNHCHVVENSPYAAPFLVTNSSIMFNNSFIEDPRYDPLEEDIPKSLPFAVDDGDDDPERSSIAPVYPVESKNEKTPVPYAYTTITFNNTNIENEIKDCIYRNPGPVDCLDYDKALHEANNHGQSNLIRFNGLILRFTNLYENIYFESEGTYFPDSITRLLQPWESMDNAVIHVIKSGFKEILKVEGQYIEGLNIYFAQPDWHVEDWMEKSSGWKLLSVQHDGGYKLFEIPREYQEPLENIPDKIEGFPGYRKTKLLQLQDSLKVEIGTTRNLPSNEFNFYRHGISPREIILRITAVDNFGDKHVRIMQFYLPRGC
jgi:hypothetical protein